MKTMSSTRPWDGLLAMLIDWIGSGDGEEVMTAVELLLRKGPAVNKFLIAKAAELDVGTVLKFRLLDVVSRIGGYRDATATRHLRALRKHECPEIRQKADEILANVPLRRSRLPACVSLSRAVAKLRQTRLNMAMGRGRIMRTCPGGRPIIPGALSLR